MRRGVLVAVLVGVVLTPGNTAGAGSRSCRPRICPADGSVRWARPLSGTWIAVGGSTGTVLSGGQAYVAVNSQVAAIGFGSLVTAYATGDGKPLWTTTLGWLPAGSHIVSVRVWPGVVTVGVLPPAGKTGLDSAPRTEVVLSARSGRRIRMLPAAAYGGAVAASARRTVIVGSAAVTGYSNATGGVIWRDPIGTLGPAWRVDDGYLYVTISAEGALGTAAVTAIRRINLRTGDERLIRPARGSFSGPLSAVTDGVMLFSGATGLTGYSARSGDQAWPAPRAGAVPVGFDPVQHVLYVDQAGALVGVNPLTGRNVPGRSVPGPPGSYDVRAGVALGLDPGAAGAAWGYSISRRHVIWTSRPVPWPHYFVDLSGIGGSGDPATGTVLLAACARTGGPVSNAGVLGGGTSAACLRPELVAIER